MLSHTEIHPTGVSNVALGFFDGLHLGHHAVISAAFMQSGRTNTVLSIGDPVRLGGKMLLERFERDRVLVSWNTDVLFCPDFAKLRGMSGEQFVADILHSQLNAGCVACGFNYTFGAGGRLGAKDLARLCADYGIECVIVDEVSVDGATVSSTAVRSYMALGDMGAVTAMLGRRWAYTLPVVHGQQLGHTLGAPTINQLFDDSVLLPRFGVYASLATVDGEQRCSVTNIGVKPTVGGVKQPLSETWILGYSGDLYGKPVRVELAGFIRPEQRFSGLDELKAQIHADAEAAAQILK